MIRYCLIKSELTRKDKKFIAMVSNSETKYLDDLISYMIREGSGLTRAQVMASFEGLTKAVEFWLANGYAISTPLFKVKASITGTFADEKERFDPKQHKLNLRASAGSALKQLEMSVTPVYTDVKSKNPVVLQFKDLTTESKNSTITPGGIAVVKGFHLSFPKEDHQQGVFLVATDDSATEVRAAVYSIIQPSEIHFQLPLAPAGKYWLEVRTILKEEEDIQVGRLPEPLLIE